MSESDSLPRSPPTCLSDPSQSWAAFLLGLLAVIGNPPPRAAPPTQLLPLSIILTSTLAPGRPTQTTHPLQCYRYTPMLTGHWTRILIALFLTTVHLRGHLQDQIPFIPWRDLERSWLFFLSLSPRWNSFGSFPIIFGHSLVTGGHFSSPLRTSAALLDGPIQAKDGVPPVVQIFTQITIHGHW